MEQTQMCFPPKLAHLACQFPSVTITSHALYPAKPTNAFSQKGIGKDMTEHACQLQTG